MGGFRKNLIIFGGISIAILVLAVANTFIQPGKKSNVPPPPSAPLTTALPFPSEQVPIITGVAPAVPFSKEKSSSLLEKMKNRPPLSPADSAIRKNLIESLGNNSGTLFVSNAIIVSYVHAPDIFQAEIKTTNIAAAKEAAISWFLGQGLSKEGICNLPLMFYLNSNIANQLRGQGIVLNPLPEGC